MSQQQWHARAVGFRAELPAGKVPDTEQVVVLLQTSNQFGDTVFCYLQLPFVKYKEMKARIANMDVVDPRAYGTIVAAGLGTPSEELQEEVKKELGIVSVNLIEPEPVPEKFSFEDLDDSDYPF